MNERIREIIGKVERIDDFYSVGPVQRAAVEDLIDRVIEQYSYDLMNIHAATPERVQFAAKSWGVEV